MGSEELAANLFRITQTEAKRDFEWSEKDLLKSVKKYRLNSRQNEIKEYNYLRIDNTNIPAKDTAQTIKEKFKFQDRRQ